MDVDVEVCLCEVAAAAAFVIAGMTLQTNADWLVLHSKAYVCISEYTNVFIDVNVGGRVAGTTGTWI